MEIQEVVNQCLLLAGLNTAEQEEVLVNGRLRQIAQGAYFFHQGEDADTLYVITAGRVKLSQVNESGSQVIVDYLGAGNGLGIIVALSNMAYPLSAEAVEACEAVAWDRETMKALMMRNPRLAFNGLDMIAGRFVRLQERFNDMATRQVEQRLARTLLRLVRQFGRRVEHGVLIDIPLSRQNLAEMTGTNLYQISRILSKWEKAGLVSSRRQSIILCKAHELVMIGEDL
ncbi:MAG: Crp/Fnr family transcriptional regulator [Candidatus Promineifilaceae bacterium]